ncbi:MAG: SOS response-associated peptidase [Chlorobi bacterium]|nr:SOS response-associated peptidase [Chlorobiota bacterium]
MCGRFQVSVKGKHISERFNVKVFDERYTPSYNCAPSQNLAVITNKEPGKLNFYKWGLVPFWSNDPRTGFKLINARAESLSEKASFKSAFSKRRCLIPANGFYEWKKEGKQKTPFRIFVETEEIFAMAGIWETWKDSEDKVLNTFAIITTEPNSLMKKIHKRMPAILNKNDELAWLFENDTDYLKTLLSPFDANKMRAYTISNKVNSPANNEASIIEEYKSRTPGLLF